MNQQPDQITNVELRQLQDLQTVPTPEILETLGRALGITWPDWYRAFVCTMLSRGYWIAGRLFGRPQPILRRTQMYRDGDAHLSRKTDDRGGPSELHGPRPSLLWAMRTAVTPLSWIPARMSGCSF